MILDETMEQSMDILNDAEVEILIEEEKKKNSELQQKALARYMKRNKKEIRRLQEHAKASLIVGNCNGYVYSLNKLRKISGRLPVSNEQAIEMYRQSKIVTDSVIAKAINDLG